MTDLDKPLHQLHLEFRWRTHEGILLKLWQMEDRHLVYSLRMIYNNFLAQYGLDPVPGGKKWGLSRRPPESWLRSVVCFMWEIETHRNLTGEYLRLYQMMKLRLLEACGVEVPWIRELEEESKRRASALPAPAATV